MGVQLVTGFHLIGNQFNGPINRLNVVPGNGRRTPDIDASNLNQGKYLHEFEKTVKRVAIDNPGKVEMRVVPEYFEGNNTNRPDSFSASYRIGDEDWTEFNYINQPGG